jgi:hypothetical protein
MKKNRVNIPIYLCLLGIVSLMISCGDKKSEEKAVKTENVEKKSIVIKYFEDDFYTEADTANFSPKLVSLKNDFPVFFLRETPAKFWKLRYSNPVFKNFSDSITEVFKQSEVPTKVNAAFGVLQNIITNDNLPEIVFWNSGFEMSDGVWDYGDTYLVAMEQYLGSNHAFYQDEAQYLAQNKDIKYVAADIVATYGRQKTKLDNSRGITLLDRIIQEGKILYMLEEALGLGKDKDDFLLKTSKQKMDWCKANEAEMWKYLIEKEYLFSSEPALTDRFIRTAPFSKFFLSFDKETPGGVGKWIGLQIVRSYMKNNSSTHLQDLLLNQDSQKILTLSKYKP